MISTVKRCSTLAAAVVAVAAACGGASTQPRLPHPAEFVGKWARLREDGTWGDTMEFRPDGTARGLGGYPVPNDLRWSVERDSAAGLQFCARVTSGGFCRPYKLSGGRLELIGGPRGNTVFRRAR